MKGSQSKTCSNTAHDDHGTSICKLASPFYALGMLFFLRDEVLLRLPFQTTYDVQLIRDLSLKSNASSSVHAMQILKCTIATFDLKTRCKAVYE